MDIPHLNTFPSLHVPLTSGFSKRNPNNIRMTHPRLTPNSERGLDPRDVVLEAHVVVVPTHPVVVPEAAKTIVETIVDPARP